jgi:hypothetical protein
VADRVVAEAPAVVAEVLVVVTVAAAVVAGIKTMVAGIKTMTAGIKRMEMITTILEIHSKANPHCQVRSALMDLDTKQAQPHESSAESDLRQSRLPTSDKDNL